MVRVSDLLDVPTVAEMVAVVFDPTLTVLTVNVIEVFPAGTVTVAGTLASTDSLASVTTTPAAGAAPERVTVPVEFLPPASDVGLSFRLATAGGMTVRLADSPVPFKLALMEQDV